MRRSSAARRTRRAGSATSALRSGGMSKPLLETTSTSSRLNVTTASNAPPKPGLLIAKQSAARRRPPGGGRYGNSNLCRERFRFALVLVTGYAHGQTRSAPLPQREHLKAFSNRPMATATLLGLNSRCRRNWRQQTMNGMADLYQRPEAEKFRTRRAARRRQIAPTGSSQITGNKSQRCRPQHTNNDQCRRGD